MIALRRVLVPTDFSEASEAAVRYGIVLARAFNAQLHLLHVPEKAPEMAETEFPLGLFEMMQNAARDQLGHILTPQEEKDVRAEYVMRVGAPYEEIVRYANDHDIDLIVMGTHGRGFVAHMLLGSVAEKVVRKGPCPVLTVRHPQHEFIMSGDAVEQSAHAGG